MRVEIWVDHGTHWSQANAGRTNTNALALLREQEAAAKKLRARGVASVLVVRT